MFNYKEVKKKNIEDLFMEYVKSLSGVYDDFLEMHILNSKFNLITYNNVEIGYFAVFEEKMLTQFFIEKNHINLSQLCFKDIVERYNIENCFVPTCDELFLSVSVEAHKEISIQAYFFSETDKSVAPPSFDRELLRPATEADFKMIKSLSGDFFDDLDNPNEQVYVLEDSNTVYGFGIIANGKIHTGYKGTGMFTVEEHRQKGVGRSIILHLKDICHEGGFSALPGCWFYNYNSKKTLESCGYISKTRLLKIEV